MKATFLKTCAVAFLITAAPLAQSVAYEAGYPGTQIPPGIAIGNTTAAAPGSGIYMFDQVWTYQAHFTGSGAPNAGGVPASLSVNSPVTGFVFVPGCELLGATYDAMIVQPAASADTSAPVAAMKTGFHNTFVVPIELSWKLGQSGFFAKAGLGISMPDGSISGTNGLGNIGDPWWTFRPEFIFSYLRDGWNLTSAFYYEANTRNTVTQYRSGDVLDAEFVLTKQIGKWTARRRGLLCRQYFGTRLTVATAETGKLKSIHGKACAR